MTDLHSKLVTPSFSPDPRVIRSLRHSIRDGVAYSVMSGAGESYFAAYALFLGATTAQVALLAAVPPLFGAFTQLLAAWLEARLGVRRGLILVGALLHAATWLPLVALPYFFPTHAIPLTVGCIVLYYGWIGLGSPVWCSVMGDLVPSRKRGRFFGARTRLMSVTSFIALVIAGLLLHVFQQQQLTQLGFLVVFGAAALARLYSTYHLARMYTPPLAQVPTQPLPARLPAMTAERARFRKFSTFIGLMNFAVSVAAPFFTVFMLRDLGFSYLQFMIATAASIVTQFTTLRTWGRLTDVFGNRFVLGLTSIAIPVIPALWLVSPNFGWVIAIQALAGVMWGGFTLAAGNYLYEIVPAEQRTSRWATHNLINSLGVCAGALFGGWVAANVPDARTLFAYAAFGTSGLWAVILLSALLRGLVAILFVPRLEEVRQFRAPTLRALVFRLIPSRRIAGMVLDALGAGRRQGRPARVALAKPPQADASQP